MPISLLCESVVAVTPPGVLTLRDETSLLVRDDLASTDALRVLRYLPPVAVIHSRREGVDRTGQIFPVFVNRLPIAVVGNDDLGVSSIPLLKILQALEEVDHLGQRLVVRALNLPDDRLRQLPNRQGLIRHSVQDSGLKQVSHLVGAIPVIPREQLVIVPVLHADLVTELGQESLPSLLLKFVDLRQVAL